MDGYNQYPQNAQQAPKAPFTQPPSAILPDENNNNKIISVAFSAILIVVIVGAVFFVAKERNQQTEDTNLSANQKSQPTINLENSPTPLPLVQGSKEKQNFYSNLQFGISFAGPQDWEKIENSAGTLVIFKSPKKENGDTNAQLQGNLNLTVDTNLLTTNLDAYTKQANTQRASSFQNYKLLGTTKETLGGQTAQIDDFISTSNSVDLRQRQVYTIKGASAFVLTFTATAPDWDKLLPVFDNARNYFSFNGVVSGARTGF